MTYNNSIPPHRAMPPAYSTHRYMQPVQYPTSSSSYVQFIGDLRPPAYPAHQAIPSVQYPASSSSRVGGQRPSRAPNVESPPHLTPGSQSRKLETQQETRRVELDPIEFPSRTPAQPTQTNPPESGYTDEWIKGILQALRETDSDQEICDQTPKSEDPFLADEKQNLHRIQQREKQIHFALTSRGYINLCFISQESEFSLLTPPSMSPECSKRTFDMKLGVWKRNLHKYAHQTLPLCEMKKHPSYDRIKRETEDRLKQINSLFTNFEDYIEYLEKNKAAKFH